MARPLHISLVLVCSVYLLPGVSLAAAPDEHGQVSTDTLKAMGLARLAPLSDAAGTQIRGRAVIGGTPGNGFFVTDVSDQALANSHHGEDMPGRVLHHYKGHPAVIAFHPKFGVKYPGRP